jgi:hypothetical protein
LFSSFFKHPMRNENLSQFIYLVTFIIISFHSSNNYDRAWYYGKIEKSAFDSFTHKCGVNSFTLLEETKGFSQSFYTFYRLFYCINIGTNFVKIFFRLNYLYNWCWNFGFTILFITWISHKRMSILFSFIYRYLENLNTSFSW